MMLVSRPALHHPLTQVVLTCTTTSCDHLAKSEIPIPNSQIVRTNYFSISTFRQGSRPGCHGLSASRSTGRCCCWPISPRFSLSIRRAYQEHERLPARPSLLSRLPSRYPLRPLPRRPPSPSPVPAARGSR